MSDPTYADAITAQTQTQIRDGLLADLAASGSTVGGLPTSSPERGLIESEAAQLALEQRLRAGVARAATITGAASTSDSWTDADATWYQVDNGSGGTGRILATRAVWSMGLKVASAAAPVTLTTGQTLQVQAADSAHTVFNLALLADVTMSAGSSYKGTVRVVARLAGTGGNVAASALQNGAIITSGVAGLSVDASVLPVLTTAARDQETSAQLRDRCLASWGRLGAGWTKQAFDYLIPLFAPTVTQWIVRDDNPYGPGTVGVVLADAAGPAGSDEIASVSTGLNGAATRPLGSGLVTVTAAALHTLVVTATLANDGSNASLHTAALAALTLLQGVFPVGGTLDPSLTIGLLRGDPIGTATVVMYDGTTKTVAIDAPGFASVSGVALAGACASPVVLAWNEWLSITPAVTP